MNSESQRECPFCAETIRSAARVCPRCRRWVTWKSLSNPFISACLFGAVYIFMLVIGAGKFRQLLNPPPYFADYPDSLQVLEFRTNWLEKDGQPRIVLTGLLTNKSEMAWKDIELECRFFDSNNAMIDAATTRAYVTILPRGDAAFRANVSPIRSTNEYATLKVNVSNARNGKTLF